MASELQPIRGRGWLIFLSIVLLIAGLFVGGSEDSKNRGASKGSSSRTNTSSNNQKVRHLQLDVARREISEILARTYKALNDGQPSAVADVLSTAISRSTEKLDFVCRPFSYRAHYIESVFERPNSTFQVLVHVLFHPLEERYHLLTFSTYQNRLFLSAAEDVPETILDSDLKAANETARKFVYAIMARDSAVAQSLAVPDLDVSWLLKKGDPYRRALVDKSVELVPYKGLKLLAIYRTRNLETRFSKEATWSVGLEKINRDLKIVYWRFAVYMGVDEYREDPNLESRTLARFGLGPGA